MSIFSTILSKLGLGKKTAATTSTGATIAKRTFLGARPTAISQVDVVSKLNALAKTSKQPLDWKVSIVDLLKLLGIDSSQTNRKELATELGCPENLMKDSAAMNTWLHKTVMQKLADNGGNIPQELL